jgi:hypothetical protein
MSAPDIAAQLHLGCGPPSDAAERMERAVRYLRKIGESGIAADVAAFMWSVRGMDLIIREQVIHAQWPGLAVDYQIKATKLYRRIEAKAEKAQQKAPAA